MRAGEDGGQDLLVLEPTGGEFTTLEDDTTALTPVSTVTGETTTSGRMKTDLVIAQLDTARLALRDAKTLQDTKRVLDVAAAAEIYAKRQQLSQDSIDYAHDIKISALAQLGKMLQAAPKATGAAGPGRGKAGAKAGPAFTDAPTLDDLGLTKKQSALAQKLAELPPEQFEQVKAGTTSVTKAIREVVHAKRPPVVAPKGSYRVFYADPPWSYGNSGLQQYGHASHHYPTMTIDELCALPIEKIAQKDAALFLWVTSPLLMESAPVIEAWGFTYKTSIVWSKDAHVFGHYVSVRHEFLLLCTRGSCTPDIRELLPSIVTVKRSKTHSEKPEEFRRMIDTMYPKGARIELFSRSKHKDWDSWGNEVPDV